MMIAHFIRELRIVALVAGLLGSSVCAGFCADSTVTAYRYPSVVTASSEHPISMQLGNAGMTRLVRDGVAYIDEESKVDYRAEAGRGKE